MTYHLESDSTAIYFWRDGGPCIAILPVDQDPLLWFRPEHLGRYCEEHGPFVKGRRIAP